MNCNEFSDLLADALGDELSPANREGFEAHRAGCERCRGEYEEMRSTLGAMRRIADVPAVSVRRSSGRLVLEPPRAHPGRRAYGLSGGPLRRAAGIVLGFLAGYAAHAVLRAGSPVTPEQVVMHDPADRPRVGLPSADSLQQAFVRTHVRNPARSDLAKCLVAMAGSKR